MFRRRQLLNAMTLAGAASALPGGALASVAKGRPLDILVMGGTGFIGPHIVRALLTAGHRITLFNRGKSNPGLFADLELIKGDRLTDDIRQLAGRRWDAVVDCSCYVPRAVNLLMDVIDRQALRHYLFISTISVYADFSRPGLTERSELATMEDPTSEDVRAHYGALKVLCEQAAAAAVPGKVLAIRCGLIIGPGDHTDRFTYWPVRIARGGEVLGPGDGSQPIQTLDARDLADWVAYSLALRVTGTFNATSQAGTNTFGSALADCQRQLGVDSRITWVDDAFLLEQGVEPNRDLPFWAPAGSPLAGVWQVDSSAATEAGLKHRPLADTIRDLHTWYQAQPAERRATLRAGWSADREAQVLAAWHSLHGRG